MRCAVCNETLCEECVPYQVGPMAGRMCMECGKSMMVAITRWMGVRMRDVAKERANAEREAYLSALAADIANKRMLKLYGETLPRGKRSAA